MSTARAAQPSYLVLPQSQSHDMTVLSYLCERFPHIAPETWRDRMQQGLVSWQDGSLIDSDSRYRSCARVYYYREVVAETKIPFEVDILYQDPHIVIAHKPHFLPVTPSGNYVNECLVHRLRLATGIDTLVPAHRLDRETAGIVLLSVNPDTRHLYHALFSAKTINKQYHGIARLTPELLALHQSQQLRLPCHWRIENRIKPANPSFLMQIVPGDANSHSEISLVAVAGDLGLFELSPITGKTHQLRVHMLSLGMPLLNDRFYPQLQAKGPDNFNQPLQLLARRLSFVDPVTAKSHDWQVPGLSLQRRID
ncbi:pseudouridine synthase [Shewanella sp. NIFS-20-20]|uniref:pseudouridine synthase n=1 Tax=Shewanella sp. NIFS-20-20 TaxID=2853806 RepID=UPI001C464606|nr:pseudouridine synthase [Shewanella sp. NIFS-20-20]MBV7315286.1 pseudouridine synthase [Shewanella sp. NIFS-20-20]